MKKLLLAFVGAALFGSAATAQTDIGVTSVQVFNWNDISTPIAPGADITIGDTLWVAFGWECFADTVHQGDTLTFVDVTTGFQDYPVAFVADTTYAPGEGTTLLEPAPFSTANLSAGAFQVCVSSTLAGDGNAANDETCVSFNLIASTGIAERSVANNLFYSNNALHFQLNGAQPSKLTVFDLTGKPVVQQTVAPGNQRVELGHVSNGIYIVRIEAGNRVLTEKIVKQ